MSESLQHIFDSVRLALPSVLISQDGAYHISRVNNALPAELTTFCGLECRLGQEEALADISMEIKRDSIGHHLLSGKRPSSLDELCSRPVPWRELRKFAQLWSGPNHPFHVGIRNIWTEFDAAKIAFGTDLDEIIAHPCIFFGMAKTGSVVDIGSVLNTIDPSGGPHEVISDAFIRFRKALPEKAELFQVGLMLARSSRALRVCVSGIAPDTVSSWLSDIKWPGDSCRCRTALETLAPKLKSICVDLNLSPNGIDKKIGLECYMDSSKDGISQWHSLLSFAEEQGLCLPKKRLGLNGFSGTSPSPARMRKGSNGILYINTVRKIHHLKLNFDGDTFTEAKVYMSLNRPGINPDKMLMEFGGKKRSSDIKESEEAWLIP